MPSSMLYAPWLRAARVIVGVNHLKASSWCQELQESLDQSWSSCCSLCRILWWWENWLPGSSVDGSLLWMEAYCNIPSSLEGIVPLSNRSRSFTALSDEPYTPFCKVLFIWRAALPVKLCSDAEQGISRAACGKGTDQMHSQGLFQIECSRQRSKLYITFIYKSVVRHLKSMGIGTSLVFIGFRSTDMKTGVMPTSRKEGQRLRWSWHTNCHNYSEAFDNHQAADEHKGGNWYLLAF